MILRTLNRAWPPVGLLFGCSVCWFITLFARVKIRSGYKQHCAPNSMTEKHSTHLHTVLAILPITVVLAMPEFQLFVSALLFREGLWAGFVSHDLNTDSLSEISFGFQLWLKLQGTVWYPCQLEISWLTVRPDRSWLPGARAGKGSSGYKKNVRDLVNSEVFVGRFLFMTLGQLHNLF